jgi:cytochrome c oxidase subunit 2
VRVRLAAGLAAAALAFAVVALTAGIGRGGSEAARSATTVAADVESGRAVFARMGCGGCHTLAAAGSRGGFGPDLDERLPMHDRASLIAKIARPPAGGEDFSMMPRNFGARMNAAELNALVDFLLSVR